MNVLLKEFMSEYSQNFDELVDSEKRYYKLLEIITEKIKKKLSDEYLVKGSCGQGRKSECPWICVFNKNITKGARNGIYYAILFKSDMTGFYLSLCLGMESFKEKFGSDWEKNLKEVAEYFRSRININTFNLTKIDLNVARNTRGHGYETSNIIAKYYELEKNEYELEEDINKMTKIYESICEMVVTTPYSDIIDNILSYSNTNLISIEEAKTDINQAILKEFKSEVVENKILREIEIPKIKTTRKFKEMTKKQTKKKDYIETAKKQAKNGLKGEQLVMEYEKQKMISNGREDLINKINWVAEVDDNRGYDIESFDFDEEGKEFRIYIEVKTTEKNEKKEFFMSDNEVKTMEKLNDRYWIYRVCEMKKEFVFFKINGKDFKEKISLKNYTYIAEIN